MSDRIKKIKIKQTDGTFSDYIPIGANAKDIDLQYNDSNVENTLKKKPYYYDNIATMKLDDTLREGDMAITLGYYEVNDGGGAEYRIINDESLEDDGGSIHELNNGLKASLNSNNIYVDMFGAKGDGVTDDSLYIGNAINYINTIKGILHFSKKTYLVSTSFFVRAGVSIEGNFATITPLNGSYIENFIFLLNTKDAKNWVEEWAGRGFVRNLRFENPQSNLVEGIKIFCLGEGDFEFKEIRTNHFYGFCHSLSYYLDNISFIKISCLYSYGNDFMIKKQGQGDGLLIDRCHFAADSSIYNQKAIYISGSWGCRITNLINGEIELNNCINTTIENAHIERGSITLQNSIITINNSYIWKNLDMIPITIIDTDFQGGYGNGAVTISTTLNNVIFELRYASYSYDVDTVDIDTYDCNRDLIINNCYRRAEPTGANYARMSLTGLMIKTRNKNILAKYQNYIISNSYIRSNEGIYHSNILTPSNGIIISIQNDTTISSDFEEKTYYYKAILLPDIDRMIYSGVSEEKSIIKNNTTDVSVLVIRCRDINMIIRIYRGDNSNSYNKYVDIPCPKNLRLYDNGKTLNGFEWKDRIAGDIEETSIYTECYKSINPFSEQIEVYGNDIPTIGNWKTGDIIYNTNPSTNMNLGWICISGGNPGTWKSMSIISE